MRDRAAAVVVKLFLQPGRGDFRKVITQVMPKILWAGHSMSSKKQMQEILERMTVKFWHADRARLLQLLAAT